MINNNNEFCATQNELDLYYTSDVLFNASHPGDWLDPLNWCPTDIETGPCKTTPLLHTEMVPCVTDDVLFPRGSSYYVDLGANLNLQVNTMKVSGKVRRIKNLGIQNILVGYPFLLATHSSDQTAV